MVGLDEEENMSHERYSTLESDLLSIQRELVKNKGSESQRPYFEKLYLDRLQELRKEPQHVWKPYVHWYTRFQGW
jgi:hypothetical protein